MVARRGRRFLGFVLFRDCDEWVDINDLAVHPDFQRRGIGYALCEEAVNWARELGHEKVTALPISSGSGKIFARIGFRKGGVLPGYSFRLS